MPKRNSCIDIVISATKWLPVLFVIAIFAWGLYAYTLPFAFNSIDSQTQRIVILLIFYALYILSIWSYVQTIFTPNVKIPKKFYITPDYSEELANAPNEQARNQILIYLVKKNDLPIACRTYSGGIRFCEKCNLIKPDRSHHCSMCKSCILKMDHHCPWINNCVSFSNYKFFVLFLGYTFMLCIFVGVTTFPYFIKFWSLPELSPRNGANPSGSIVNQGIFGQSTDGVPFSVRFHILFLFFIACMLSLGVMFLYFYHIFLLIKNRSTLESFRPPLMSYGPDRNAFNLGTKENILQIFGRSKLLWIMPIFTTEGSGLAFDQRPQLGMGDEEARQELLNHHPNNTRTRPNDDTEV